MTGRGISLGHIFGIEIELDWTWFLIFALVTWALAAGYFPAEFHNWPTAEYWGVGAATAILFFVSVLLHELAHSVVAIHYGIPVNQIRLFIFGGVSQIEEEPKTAGNEFIMAVVGPLTSLVLGGALAGISVVTGSIPPVQALARYLAFINVALGVFNLIPGFPLDGGRVFRSIVWAITGRLPEATEIAGNVGRVFGWLFILGGVYLAFTTNLIDGLWLGFVGWFLESAAASQVRQQKIQDLLAGHKVSEVMNRAYTSVPSNTTVQELVDEHILGAGRRSLVVKDDGHIEGLLTLHAVRDLNRETWPNTAVNQIMIPTTQLKRIAPSAEIWDAMEEMNREGVNQLPVMSDGDIEGMLSREDIISYLQTLQELRS